MGKIGWGEFLLILIIALIVVGPDKLPEIGKALGKAVRSVKLYVNDAVNEIADVDEIKEMKKDIESIKTDVTSIGKDLEKTLEDTRTETEKAVTDAVTDTEKALKDTERAIADADKAIDREAAARQAEAKNHSETNE